MNRAWQGFLPPGTISQHHSDTEPNKWVIRCITAQAAKAQSEGCRSWSSLSLLLPFGDVLWTTVVSFFRALPKISRTLNVSSGEWMQLLFIMMPVSGNGFPPTRSDIYIIVIPKPDRVPTWCSAYNSLEGMLIRQDFKIFDAILQQS